MSDVFETIRAAGVLPVVTIDDADLAVPLVDALQAGGLSVVEVTLRTDAGLAAIKAIATHSPSTCVGAGSVTTADQANAAADAGAKFLVSPGLDDGVVIAAREHRVPVIPGIATPTELMRAIAHHLHVVKLFPAETLGGRSTLQALSAVWPDVRFVPTGGISADNAASYLADGHVLAVGGSWVAPRKLIAARDWAHITALASAAMDLAGGVR
ncbi:MAG: bifunctional 4-hydroxy-2-oxoglutarate aldolase/2-dehydro-3-deoxy-phosphogluconate aldolase [Acidimicrobiales bacterium]